MHLNIQSRIRLCRLAIVLAIAFALLESAIALLGGFGVAVFLPKADDPRQNDAALIIQPIGCHGPGASVVVKAEGMMHGQRRTIILESILLDKGDERDGPTYMLPKRWAASRAFDARAMRDAKWLLTITAKRGELDAHAIVRLDPAGNVLAIDRPRERNWSEATTLADGKTKMLLYPFSGEAKVAATYIVSGNLEAAVDYSLRALE